eukprot:363466-Chlamydomonas_euryale.AAC.15
MANGWLRSVERLSDHNPRYGQPESVHPTLTSDPDIDGPDAAFASSPDTETLDDPEAPLPPLPPPPGALEWHNPGVDGDAGTSDAGGGGGGEASRGEAGSGPVTGAEAMVELGIDNGSGSDSDERGARPPGPTAGISGRNGTSGMLHSATRTATPPVGDGAAQRKGTAS